MRERSRRRSSSSCSSSSCSDDSCRDMMEQTNSGGSSVDTLVQLRGQSGDSGAWDCLVAEDRDPVKRRRRSSSASVTGLLTPTTRFSTLSEPPSWRLAVPLAAAPPRAPLSSMPAGGRQVVVVVAGTSGQLAKVAKGAKVAKVGDDTYHVTKAGFFRKVALTLKECCLKYRHTRISSKKMRKRVVQKNGECNVSPSNVAKRRRRYLQDIFTTLVDIQWRWTLLVFAMSFISSWLLFAVVWWVIAYTHGDLLEHNLPGRQEQSKWTPCVVNIFSFTSCFLFSVETQHTIGYGSRHTTEECPEAIFVMCIQSITGVMIQAFMVGIVFAKLSRPKKRTQTLLFSRNACLCLRDGEMCLLFRVGDMRKSHIIEAHVRAQLIRKRVTREGEILPFFQYELDVGYDIGEDRIFFIWPMTMVHKINENSPLYDLSAHDLLREKFEIVVILEGVIESTGMTTQARSSYLPNEILWGYRFENLVTFNKDLGEYAVDYSLFNNTYQVNTPLYSARELDRLNSQESTPEREDSGPSSPPKRNTLQVTPLTPVTPMSPLTPTSASGVGVGSCSLDLHACPHSACDTAQDAPASQPLLQEHNNV
nr:ATP-sensitive inward rectifier potassium channel 12-like isoform X3 [Procambarus clarkii]XP_045596109.1 ATP-sensitive inward rectifier potassium channel 12-like isoform X3 [Procambarus clarkii]